MSNREWSTLVPFAFLLAWLGIAYLSIHYFMGSAQNVTMFVSLLCWCAFLLSGLSVEVRNLVGGLRE